MEKMLSPTIHAANCSPLGWRGLLDDNAYMFSLGRTQIITKKPRSGDAIPSNRHKRGGERHIPNDLNTLSESDRQKRRDLIANIKAKHVLNPYDMVAMHEICHRYSDDRPPFCVVSIACDKNQHWLIWYNPFPEPHGVQLAVWKETATKYSSVGSIEP